MQREGDLMLVPKHWSHATLNVESGISVAIFLLDKYDSSTPQAYIRHQLEVRSNLTDIDSGVVRSVFGRETSGCPPTGLRLSCLMLVLWLTHVSCLICLF